MPFCLECNAGGDELASPCPNCGEGHLVADRVDPESADAFVGRKLVDKYVVVASLSAGGMGSIFRAIQQPVGREVAVKVLHTELASDYETRQRFEREARAVAQITHPNVVTLHDFGFEDDGNPYMVMEFVEGRNLDDWIAAESPELPRVLDVFRQVLSVLSAAHERGIVHRDLKAANVLVTKSSEERDFVKVLDFGVARILDQSKSRAQNLTERGEVYGTPHYMAPEQAKGDEDVGTASDVYAAGILLYEMLTGELPFDGSSALHVLKQQCDDPLPELDPRPGLTVPAPLEQIVDIATAKDIDDRFPDAGAMLERFDEFGDPDRSGRIQAGSAPGTGHEASDGSAGSAGDGDRGGDVAVADTVDSSSDELQQAAASTLGDEESSLTQDPDRLSQFETEPDDPWDHHDAFFDPDEGTVTSDEDDGVGADDTGVSVGPGTSASGTSDRPRVESPAELELDDSGRTVVKAEEVDPSVLDESETSGGRASESREEVGGALLRKVLRRMAVVLVTACALGVAGLALWMQWAGLPGPLGLVVAVVPVVATFLLAELSTEYGRFERTVGIGLFVAVFSFAIAHLPAPGRLARNLEKYAPAVPEQSESAPAGGLIRRAAGAAARGYGTWLAEAVGGDQSEGSSREARKR